MRHAPGSPASITDAKVEEVITRTMAAASGRPQSKRHRAGLAGLYLNPPEETRAVESCGDEKSHVQALNRSQPVLPMRPGQAERRTHDNYRGLFAWCATRRVDSSADS